MEWSTEKQETTEIKETYEIYEVKPMGEEERRRQLQKLKKRKAAGKNGIPNEAWLKAPDNGIRRKAEIMNELRLNESIPKQWSEKLICPTYTKETGRRLKTIEG